MTGVLDTLFRAGEYKEENETLREEIRQLRQQLVDYETVNMKTNSTASFWNSKTKSGFSV